MRLTDYTDYTLRVLIHLNRTKEVFTLQELSKQLGVSRNNLTKISNKLVKLGYVDAARGRSGGLRIRKEAGRAYVGDIVRQMEESLQLAQCFSGEKSSCSFFGGCALKVSLQGALEAFIDSLNKYTLNDITPVLARKSL